VIACVEKTGGKQMFENHRVFTYQFAGRPLIIETGKIAQLSNSSCLVRYGDTTVLANATASAKPRDGIDYMPLAVDFEERLYSVGKIPGSFLKREGRPTDKAILASRVIDRPIRPLFPKDLRNDIVLSLLVMSVDPDNSPEIAGMIGASIALTISDIPWGGPIGGAFIGLVDGRPVVNPTASQRDRSDLELTIACTAEKVVMIEAGANEVPEAAMLEAIIAGHNEIKGLLKFIETIKAEIGKPKFAYEAHEVSEELYDKIKGMVFEDVKAAIDTDDKTVRDTRMQVITDRLNAELLANPSANPLSIEDAAKKAAIGECLYKLQKYIVRRWLLDEQKRVDGRKLDQIRPLAAEVGFVPRVHGSALFTRGQTQVATIATLGPIADQQKLDGIDMEEFKRYMHHYNFPGYSVGEAKASRSPGRREIGHGALAERSLVPVLPTEEEFPYAIRLVSEVVSSNGSTSQGSVCGSTLALMDAGVPIKAPVAGISCGLITEGERWMTMIDIQGVEDFYGDMDFKVAGTHRGITSIQMDLKIDGLTYDIIKEAFAVTRRGRIYILDNIILKAIDRPRPDVSPYAPKMLTLTIPVDKIREVIGSGGKVIQKIQADCHVKIDIEDDGRVFISAINRDDGYAALEVVKSIVFEPEVGSIFTGKVTGILSNVGCFVEYAPGKEGLVHISKLDFNRVEKTEDVVKMGDMITVMYLGLDDKSRVRLSRKDAMKQMQEQGK